MTKGTKFESQGHKVKDHSHNPNPAKVRQIEIPKVGRRRRSPKATSTAGRPYFKSVCVSRSIAFSTKPPSRKARAQWGLRKALLFSIHPECQ